MKELSSSGEPTCISLQRNNLSDLYKAAKENINPRIRSMRAKHTKPPVIIRQYKDLTNLLRKSLDKYPQMIIAIDGVDGSGKTTLARYLAWQLNLSLIELDLCRKQQTSNHVPEISNGGIPALKTNPELLQPLIQACQKMIDPVILEGIFVLQALENVGFEADFYITVTKKGWRGSFDFSDYNKKFVASKPDYEVIVENY